LARLGARKASGDGHIDLPNAACISGEGAKAERTPWSLDPETTIYPSNHRPTPSPLARLAPDQARPALGIVPDGHRFEMHYAGTGFLGGDLWRAVFCQGIESETDHPGKSDASSVLSDFEVERLSLSLCTAILATKLWRWSGADPPMARSAWFVGSPWSAARCSFQGFQAMTVFVVSGGGKHGEDRPSWRSVLASPCKNRRPNHVSK